MFSTWFEKGKLWLTTNQFPQRCYLSFDVETIRFLISGTFNLSVIFLRTWRTMQWFNLSCGMVVRYVLSLPGAGAERSLAAFVADTTKSNFNNLQWRIQGMSQCQVALLEFVVVVAGDCPSSRLHINHRQNQDRGKNNSRNVNCFHQKWLQVDWICRVRNSLWGLALESK